MKDLKTIRGMPDLYAEEMNRISFVEDVCTEIFRSFNFQEFRTPILENKSKTLMKAIDYTNAKYGRNAISIAQAGVNNDWRMRREHSSRIDTASFDLLPKINV